ncbi:hypothetical protein CLV28_1139 [Sediminihabitans luteus]|uniref:Uncharacterized protein n=1 Tax=Sediminihabitans luteus TaxID=1138585 RepID=A0A2M9D1G7_9CELL|nr:hypothetical protein [Sediminihabitans luteus]PJJ77913.1 hypothetical protein CLV28_1139 [Sediminihabitans luteus]GII99730.1 hypothetical protein Slu03_21080 [Sediminihabitans luteus]
MSALDTARRAAALHAAGVSAATTRKVASVVRTAGTDAVLALGPRVLADVAAGRALHAVLRDLGRRPVPVVVAALDDVAHVQAVLAAVPGGGPRAVRADDARPAGAAA